MNNSGPPNSDWIARWQRIARRIRVPLGFIAAALYLFELLRPRAQSNCGGLEPGAGSAWPLASCIRLRLRQKKSRASRVSSPMHHTRNPLYLGSMLIAAGFARAWRVALLRDRVISAAPSGYAGAWPSKKLGLGNEQVTPAQRLLHQAPPALPTNLASLSIQYRGGDFAQPPTTTSYRHAAVGFVSQFHTFSSAPFPPVKELTQLLWISDTLSTRIGSRYRGRSGQVPRACPSQPFVAALL